MGLSSHKKASAGILLSFTTWGEGKVFTWLSSLSNQEDRMITKLQIRKDTRRAVPHRFVVLHMQNGKVHRFDRRPEGHTFDVLEGPTKDECVHDLDEEATGDIECNTANEIELLDLQVDLEVVVATCFEIAQDPKSQQYSLRTHNCFFFSWTIFMAVARRCLPYRKPQSDMIVESFVTEHIVPVRDFIVKEVLDFFLFVIIETGTMFLDKALKRPSIVAGLPIISSWLTQVSPGRVSGLVSAISGMSAISGISGWVIRSTLEAVVSNQLSDLQEVLEIHVEKMLHERVIELADQVLKQPETHSLLDGKLWLTDLDKIVRPAVEQEFIKILWESFADISVTAFGDNLLIRTRLTKRWAANQHLASLQEYAVPVIATLHGGIQAARIAAEAGKNEQLSQSMAEIQERYRGEEEERQGAAQNAMLQSYNQRMFKLVWEACGEGSVSSGKNAVKEIYNMKENEESTGQSNKEVREKMWEEIWVVWKECWDGACPEASKNAVAKLAGVIDRFDTIVNTIVIELLQNATVRANIPKISPKHGDQLEFSPMQKSMTNGQLQEFMRSTMKDARGLKLEGLNDTMARIWSKVHKRIPAEVGGKSRLGATSG